MKRVLATLLFLIPSLCFAQSTTVSLSVTDTPDSQTWNNGTYQTFLIGAQTPSWPGGAITITSAVTALSATGTASFSLPDNNTILPSGTQWRIQVCAATLPVRCFSQTLTITGSAQTVALAPPSPRFTVPTTPQSIAPITAYADTEISGGWVGFTYTNVSGTATPRICTAVTGATCTTWAAAGGSASSVSSLIYAWDSKYGVKANTQMVCDATKSSGSGAVSTPATDVPFTAAVIGMSALGTTGDCQNANGTPPVTDIAQTTILTFTDAHHITTAANASQNCTPTNSNLCVFVWGTPDTIAMQAAWQAAASLCGGSLEIQAGGVWLDAFPGATNIPACTGIAGGGSSPMGLDVHGKGMQSTWLFFSPSVPFTNTLFSTSTPTYQFYVHDMQFSSWSAAPSAANNQSALVATSAFNHFYNLYFESFFPSASQQLTVMNLSVCASCWAEAHDISFSVSGARAMIIGGGPTVTLSHIFVGSPPALVLSVGNISGMAIHIDHFYVLNLATSGAFGGAAVDFSLGSGTVECDECIFQGGGSNAAAVVRVTPGSALKVILHNVSITNSSSNTSSTALTTNANGTVIFDGESNSVSSTASGASAISNAGSLTLRNTSSSAVGAGVALNNTGTVLVKEGNTFTNGLTNTGTIQVLEGVSGYTGTGTGTATSASTLGLYGLGQWAGPALNSTVTGNGRVMQKAGTVVAVYATAGTAGNQAADAISVVKNHQGTVTVTTMTCSLNGVTTCTDGASGHQVAYVAGDILSAQVVSGTGTTLANVAGTVVTQ